MCKNKENAGEKRGVNMVLEFSTVLTKKKTPTNIFNCKYTKSFLSDGHSL